MLANIKGYLRKSFSVFTNPEFAPDKKVLDKAIDWVNRNVVSKNKDLREEAAKFPGKASKVEKERTYADALVKKILQSGKQDDADPLSILQRISKYDLRSNFKNRGRITNSN